MSGGRRPGAGRRKGSYELAGRIREAVRKAIELGEEEGTPLEVMLKDAMVHAPMKFLQTVIPLLPKELDISNRNPMDLLSDDELADIIATLKSIGTISPVGIASAGEEGCAEEPDQLH